MRKTFGILLIVLGWFIAFCGFLAVIPNIIKTVNEGTEIINKVSFLTGTFIGAALIAFLAFLSIRTGIRLTKKKKTDNVIDKIESIK